jgi:hypothetical protein
MLYKTFKINKQIMLFFCIVKNKNFEKLTKIDTLCAAWIPTETAN